MNKVFIFTLGAAVGSLLTWKLIEKKYKDLADEEINAVREYYIGKHNDNTENVEVVEAVTETIDEEENEYKDLVNHLGYVEDENGYVYVTPLEEKIDPYVISPEEYGDKPGYDTKEWTYYADGVVTDENDDIVWDPEGYLGDGLKHFGEYEDDSVHVRNEYMERDYEVLKHEKKFSEIYGEDS